MGYTITGSPKIIDTPNKNAGAWEFDGNINNYVDVSTNPLFNFVGNDRSVAFWVYRNNGDFHYVLADHGTNSADYGYWIRIEVDGRIMFHTSSDGTGSTGGSVTSTAGDVPVGEWTHVAVTYKNSNGAGQIYINGELKSAGTTPIIGVYQGEAAIGVSRFNGGAFALDGMLSDFKVYDKFLSSEEIKLIYTNGLPNSEDLSPIVYYDMSTKVTPGGTTTSTGPATTGSTAPSSYASGNVANRQIIPNSELPTDKNFMAFNFVFFGTSYVDYVYVGRKAEGSDADFAEEPQAIYFNGKEISPVNQLTGSGTVTTDYFEFDPTDTRDLLISWGALSGSNLEMTVGTSTSWDSYNNVSFSVEDLSALEASANYSLVSGQARGVRSYITYADEDLLGLVNQSDVNAPGVIATTVVEGRKNLAGEVQGGAITFTGSGQHITATGTSTSLPSGTQPRSLSIWFRKTGESSEIWTGIAGWGTGSTSNMYSVGLLDAGPQELCTFGFNDTHASGFLIEDNVWYHVVNTYDGTTDKIYVNGEFVSKNTESYNTASGDLIMGHVPGTITNAYFIGDLDEVRVFSKVLSAAEVNALYLSKTAAGIPEFTKAVEPKDAEIKFGQTTTTVPFNTSAAELQAQLESDPNIGPGNILVTGTSPDFNIEFIGNLAGRSLPLALSSEATPAGGSATFTEIQAGKEGTLETVAIDSSKNGMYRLVRVDGGNETDITNEGDIRLGKQDNIIEVQKTTSGDLSADSLKIVEWRNV